MKRYAITIIFILLLCVLVLGQRGGGRPDFSDVFNSDDYSESKDGTVIGQLIVWNGTKWVPTDVNELFWDDVNERFLVGGANIGGLVPWTRTGTTIYPTNIGDNVNLGTNTKLSFGDAHVEYENTTHTPTYLAGQTGLNDLSSSGTYSLTDHAVFQIKIQATGTPDNFKWRKGTSGAYTGPTAMTGSAQLLQDGVSITWAATTGHTIKDGWEINAGWEIHLNKAVHITADLTVADNFSLTGTARSLSPFKFEDGIRFINKETGDSEFHQYISGTDSAITPLPSAFDGALVFKTNVGSNPSDMDAIFWDAINSRPSFVLNQGGTGRTSVFERSLVIGAQKGIKTLDSNYTLGTTDYPRLDFDTFGTGADLGVENDAQIKGNLYTDMIAESTTNAGVTIDGLLIKDGAITIDDPGVTGIVSGGSYAASGSYPKQIDLLTTTTIRTVDFSTPGSPVTSTLIISPTAPVTFSTGDIPANTTHWITVKDNGGTPQWSTYADVTTINRREYAILGTAWTDSSNNIVGINKTPFYTASIGYDLADFILSGSFSKKISGGVISAAGAGNLLKINITEGKYWRYFGWANTTPENRHTGTDAAILPITTYYTYNATGGYATLSNVDVNNYDLNGVTTVLANNKWVAHRIYHYAGTPYDGLQRGAAFYSSLADAKSNVAEENYSRNPDNIYAAFIGYVYVKKGCTDLSDIAQADVRPMVEEGAAGGGGMSSIVEDATPQLGGDLDVNGNKITNSQGTHILIGEKVSIMTPVVPNDDYFRITGASGDDVVLGLDQIGTDNYVGISYKRDNAEYFFTGMTDVGNNFVIRNALGNHFSIDSATGFTAVGTGLAPANRLDVSNGTRTGVHATAQAMEVSGNGTETAGIMDIRSLDGTTGLSFGGVGLQSYGSNTNIDLKLATKGTGNLVLKTNSVDRLVIDGDGDVVIGGYVNKIRTVGGQGDGSVTVDFYSDDHITLRWDGNNNQPMFKADDNYLSWWDMGNTKRDGGAIDTATLRGSSDDINTETGVYYYFTAGGVRNTNFDMENYASSMTINLSKEGVTTSKAYNIRIWNSNINTFYWKLDVISP